MIVDADMSVRTTEPAMKMERHPRSWSSERSHILRRQGVEIRKIAGCMNLRPRKMGMPSFHRIVDAFLRLGYNLQAPYDGMLRLIIPQKFVLGHSAGELANQPYFACDIGKASARTIRAQNATLTSFSASEPKRLRMVLRSTTSTLR